MNSHTETVLTSLIIGICFSILVICIYKYNVSFVEQGYEQIQNSNGTLTWVKKEKTQLSAPSF